MQSDMAEKYRLQYLLLIKEFILEVERGTSWLELKPILHEMKKVDHCLECLDALGVTAAATPGFLPQNSHTPGGLYI